MHIGGVRALVGCLVISGAILGTAAAASAQEAKATVVGGGQGSETVYTVSPRVDINPRSGYYPKLVLGLGGSVSPDGTRKTYQARVVITHTYNGLQHFSSTTVNRTQKLPTRILDSSSDCGAAGPCRYTETVMLQLPEALLRSALDSKRPLRFEIRGGSAFVTGAIPLSHISAMLDQSNRLSPRARSGA